MSFKIPTRIPTLIGLLLTGILVFISSAGYKLLVNSSSSAAVSVNPASVIVTNISDTGFTVTWVTSIPAEGSVSVSGNSVIRKIFIDERDTQTRKNLYKTHSVLVRDLTPGTKYSYEIYSGSQPFKNSSINNSVTTAPTLTVPEKPLEPAYGTITLPDNKMADGALVYITLTDSQILSTLTSSTGSWLIPLNNIRTENLKQSIIQSERIEENIKVIYDSMDATAVTDTLNDSPVPPMMMGKAYDFRKVQADNSASDLAMLPSNAPTGSALGVSTEKKAVKSANYKVSIIQPQENAALVWDIPLFTGTGVPNQTVSIAIGIKDPISASTIINEDGSWRFVPAKALPMGKQSITITTQDSKDQSVAITRMFEILKSGTQVLGDATPSASLAPTRMPTPTTALTRPSATPTTEVIPTPTPDTTEEEPPVSGISYPTILLLVSSLTMFFSGLILLVKDNVIRN